MTKGKSVIRSYYNGTHIFIQKEYWLDNVYMVQAKIAGTEEVIHIAKNQISFMSVKIG